MSFIQFKNQFQKHFASLSKNGNLFYSNVDPDLLWETYLKSFPSGTDPLFRERTEHDCSSCKSFIRRMGGLLALVDGNLVSLWSGLEVPYPYDVVSNALSELVISSGIKNVFLIGERSIGTDKNRELIGATIEVWEHLHLSVPDKNFCRPDLVDSQLGDIRTTHEMFCVALREITEDSVETVLELISSNSIYRGQEKKNLVETFQTATKTLKNYKGSLENFAWETVCSPLSWICRIKNDVIGTLLLDISKGVDLESAVKSYEDKVSGTNYKRPTALITEGMKQKAKQTIVDLGLMPSLDRSYASFDDMSLKNLLFANETVKKKINPGVFDDLPTKASDPKKMSGVEEISMDKFISDVLPSLSSIEVFLENQHEENLVSLIGPSDFSAPLLFKWDNPFSWTYNGDVADSVKEKVKKAGGNVTGEICCRLAWYNTDDLDLSLEIPINNRIYFGYRKDLHSGGELDVDMNVSEGNLTTTPVENIFFPKISKMLTGNYSLVVTQFKKREDKNAGFEVEVDVLGETYTVHYPQGLSNKREIEIANILVKPNFEVVVTSKHKMGSVQKNLWGLNTGKFHPVSAFMLSPNFWDGKEIGNKHYFFMLSDCKNPGTARGFYNEFLRNELEPHRKTMEIVGSKTRTYENSSEQMSGIGFSSTKKASLLVRVTGAITRVFKVTI